MSIHRFDSFVAAAGLFSSLTTGSLFAQTGVPRAEVEGAGPSPWQLHDVVVSADKMPERPLNDSAASISTFAGAWLDAAGPGDRLGSLLELSPNVSFSREDGFSIRGIHTAEADSWYGTYDGAPTASIEVDGTLTQNHELNRSEFPLWDVARVEVLRGPTSTVRGGKNLAGAILVRTTEPDATPSGRFRFSLAEYGKLQLGVAQNVPVSPHWTFRVAAEGLKRDGFNESATGAEDVNAYDRWSLRITSRVSPQAVPELTIRLLGAYRDETLNPDGERVDVGGDDAFDRTTLPFLERNDGEAVSSTGGVDLLYDWPNNWRMKWENRWHEYDLHVPRRRDEANGTEKALETTTTSEVRLLREGEALDAVLGLYFERRQTKSAYLFNGYTAQFGGFPVVIDSMRFAGDYRRRNAAVYGQADWRIAGPWDLIAGLRLDAEHVEQDIEQKYSNLVTYLNGSDRYEDDFFEVLPKAGLRYHFDDRRSLAFVVQNAYRSGGLSVPIGSTQVSPTSYDAEKSLHYEVAWRSRWWNDSLTLNANLFHIDWTDKQERVFTGTYAADGVTPIDETRNVGEATLYGGEVEAAWFFPEQPNWLLRGGAGAVEGDGMDEGPTPTGLLATAYEPPEGPQFGAELRYRGDTQNDELDAAWILDLETGLKRNGWGAYVYSTNVLDSEYYLDRPAPSGTLQESQTALLGPPRVVGFRLERQW